MKKELLFTALMVGTSGALAQSISIDAQGPEIPSGTFYLQANGVEDTNGEALFLSRGASWGTEATMDKYGLPITYNSETKAISFYDWADTRMFSDDGSSVYTDGATSKTTTYEFVSAPDGGNLVYIKVPIKNGDATVDKYLGINKGDKGYVVQLVDLEKAQVFTISTKENHDNCLSHYKVNNNLNLVKSANITGLDEEQLKTNPNYLDDYFAEKFASTDLSSLINPSGFTYSAWSRNNPNTTAVELYQGTGAFTQTLIGLKQGIYKVTFHGFERNGWNGDQVTLGNDGYELTTTYLDANGQTVQFPSWYSDRAGDSNPNGIPEAINLFNQGKYEASTYAYVGEDGTLDLKVVAPSYKNGHWVMFNNWSLQYYIQGISDEDAQSIINQANGLLEGYKETAVQESLQKALETFVDSKTITNYNTLSAAITAAESSIAAYVHAKTALDNTATLLSQTNLYDPYSNYISEYEQNKAAYEDGSMTTAEASAVEDPLAKKGWHADSKVNDFLLSAWDGVSGYTGPFYINTWSTEGETDGTNFVVPFFEYWTQDGNELNPQTMSANYVVEDPDYTYEVNAWVRLRLTNGKEGIDFSKIKFVVGDPEATVENKQTGENNYYNVATLQSLIDNGAQVEEVPVLNSTFSLLHITKESTSDLMGNLPIQFIVEEGSNASWLSWKDIKINMTDKQATGLNKTEKANAATTNGAVYNVAGQKVNGLQKGLNIQNGKKILVK